MFLVQTWFLYFQDFTGFIQLSVYVLRFTHSTWRWTWTWRCSRLKSSKLVARCQTAYWLICWNTEMQLSVLTFLCINPFLSYLDFFRTLTWLLSRASGEMRESMFQIPISMIRFVPIHFARDTHFILDGSIDLRYYNLINYESIQGTSWAWEQK